MLLRFIRAVTLLLSVAEVAARPRILEEVLQSQHDLLHRNNSFGVFHDKRQPPPVQKICGYLTGDSRQPRSAAPGFGCRVDTRNGIWGFCPTTVIVASDCGLMGVCIDNNLCQRGCGKTEISGLTTERCTNSEMPFCSFAVLSAGADQEYTNVGCGRTAIRDVFFPSPTTTPPSSTTAVRTTSTPAPALTPAAPTPSTTSSTQASAQSSISSSTSSASSPINAPGAENVSQSASLPSSTRPPPASSSGTAAATSSNLPAIIGGSLGGLALICFTVLGIFYLRKYRRDHPSDTPESATNPDNSPEYRTSEMQVGGLHEKDGAPTVYEKDGRIRQYANKARVDSWRDSRRTRYEMPG